MTASYLGVHIQDLVGWIIREGIIPLLVIRRQELQKPGRDTAERLEDFIAAIKEYAGGEE